MFTRKRIVWGLLVLWILGWGIYLRAGNLSARPFWRDEAWVARTATQQSYGELLSQTAVPLPPLFAVASKWFNSLVSVPELGLRLFPMLCGIPCIPLTYAVVRKLRAPRSVAMTAMALCAFSVCLVLASRELKQYQVEAFLAVFLAWLVFGLRAEASARRRRAKQAGILLVCILGPWLGYGSVFPIAVLVGLLIGRGSRGLGERSCTFTGLTAVAFLAASTVAVWLVAAGGQGRNPILVGWTSNWFVDPLEPMRWLRAGGYVAICTSRVFFPTEWARVPESWGHEAITGANAGVLACFAAAVGLVMVLGLCAWPGRGRREMLCWAIGPWVFMLAAAVAQKYPFAVPRMSAGMSIPLIIIFAAGLVRIARVASIVVTSRSAPGTIAAVVLAMVPAIYMWPVPARHAYWTYHDFPKAIAALEAEHEPGEPIIVMPTAEPCVQYYGCPHCEEDCIHPPVLAGTVLVPGFDTRDLFYDTARRAGRRWWILTSSEEWPPSLWPRLAHDGHKAEIIVGQEDRFGGTAMLIRVTRRGERGAHGGDRVAERASQTAQGRFSELR